MRTESFQSLSQLHSQPRRQPHSQPCVHPLASLRSIGLASIHQLCIQPKFTVSQPASHLCFQLFSQPCSHPSFQHCFQPNYTVSQPASQPCLNCPSANLRVVSLTFSQPIFQPASLLHKQRDLGRYISGTWDTCSVCSITSCTHCMC